MNSKERVFATVMGKPVDRPPFTALLSLYGAKLIGAPLKEYYNNPNLYVEGQSAVRSIFKPDILFAPFLMVFLAEAFGGKVKYFDNSPPNLLHPSNSSVEEFLSMDFPQVDLNPKILYIRESIRKMHSLYSSDTAIAVAMLSPIEIPFMIFGIDKWMEIILFDKAGVKKVLDKTITFFIDLANALFKDGADFVALPSPLLVREITTNDLIKDVANPIYKESFSKLNGPVVIHHVGGTIVNSINLFTGLANMLGVVIDHKESLPLARDVLGPNVVLLGGPDGPNIHRYNKEQVIFKCKDILNDRINDSKFILATTGADVAIKTPEDNIHAMREAVELFRGN